MYDFSIDGSDIGKSDVLNIRKYLLVNNDIKTMFWLIKQLFVALLSFSRSLATKCESLISNKPRITRFTIIDLNPIELNYYLFMVILNKCNGSCNVAADLSTIICVLSETNDVNVKVFNMITRLNEAKTLIKHVSCDFKWKFDSETCNLNQKW